MSVAAPEAEGLANGVGSNGGWLICEAAGLDSLNLA